MIRKRTRSWHWMLACLGLVPVGGPAPGGAVVEPPSIVLITVDTLRRDHLGCYGYARATSPNIDALAEQGIVFERALAPMATTLPSHLSMMTGKYPHEHGILSNSGGLKHPFRATEESTTLAHLLGERGYDRAAFVSSIVMHSRTGISAGFEEYSVPSFNDKNEDAQETTDRVLAWLAARASKQPLFLWVHYWDTHEPNRPREEFAARFASGGPGLEWMRAQRIHPAGLLVKQARDAKNWERFFLQGRVPAGAALEALDGVEMVTDLVNRYDADLNFIDTQVGRLLKGLAQQGLGENALTIFTADHGQSLGEGHFLGHGILTSENTFVPLIVRLPQGTSIPTALPSGRTEGLVSLIDLTPTILGRLEPAFPPEVLGRMSGRDMLARDFERPHVLTLQASTPKSSARQSAGKRVNGAVASLKGKVATPASVRTYGLLQDRWKLIYRESGRHSLYDLEGAGEGVDVLATHPAVAAEMQAHVESYLSPLATEPEAQDATDAEQEQLMDNLRALGYVDDEDED